VQGEDNPNTLRNQFHLAALYREQGRYAEAERLLARELESERRVQGKEHPDSFQTSVTLGRVRLLQHKYGDAEPMLKNALWKSLEQAGDWIVDLYRDWNKPEKVAEWTQTIQQTRLASRLDR
jgi:uncharacterized protein HemY